MRKENEQRYSFHQLSDLSHRAANFLASCGFREGDRVLIMLPRVPQWWIAMLGLVRMGAVPVPATLLLTKRDVEYRVETAGIRAVITNAEGAPKVSGFEGIRVFVDTSASSADHWPHWRQRRNT